MLVRVEICPKADQLEYSANKRGTQKPVGDPFLPSFLQYPSNDHGSGPGNCFWNTTLFQGRVSMTVAKRMLDSCKQTAPTFDDRSTAPQPHPPHPSIFGGTSGKDLLRSRKYAREHQLKLGCKICSPARSLTSSFNGKPISWQKVKVRTSKQNATK